MNMLFKCSILVVAAAAEAAAMTTLKAPDIVGGKMHQRGVSPRNNITDACALVAKSAALQQEGDPDGNPIVDGLLAYQCVNSVPLHALEAVDLVTAILPFLEWQSNQAYLKSPPAGYEQSGGYDVKREFNNIIANVKAGNYINEYDFQQALMRTASAAHDGHFRYLPDLVAKTFRFHRNVSLVSVSVDNIQAPKPYVLEDILFSRNDSNFTPSPISHINGFNSKIYLEQWAQLSSAQSPDAAYNSLFWTPALNASIGGWTGYFDGTRNFGYFWPNSSTSLSFENGTEKTYQTYAEVLQDFTGIVDGNSMYQKFCNPVRPDPSDLGMSPAAASPTGFTLTDAAVDTANPGIDGYPKPVAIDSGGGVSGYYLPEYPNVAVLAILTFGPRVPAEFQATVQTFIADAKRAGKTKLVIDLSANRGGIIMQGVDTFRQLFPQIVQDGNTRFRENEAFLLMAQLFDKIITDEGGDPATAGIEMLRRHKSSLNWRMDFNTENKHFTSFDDKFSPQTFKGDNFTQLIRWDMDDPLWANTTYGVGMEITGYGSRQNFTQPFASQDIVMVYDGTCASTCTTFSELMRTQGNVTSIALGGRMPAEDASQVPNIQGIGGTKGANVYTMTTLKSLADSALDTLTAEERSLPQYKPLRDLTNTLALNRSIDQSFNVRDQILPSNVEDGTPAQFINEPANCRLFYTPEMIKDVSFTWKAVAEAAWGQGGCVAGNLDLGGGLERNAGKRRRAEDDFLTKVIEMESHALLDSDNVFWRARHGTEVPF